MQLTTERNRRHAADRKGVMGDVIAHDIKLNIRHLERRLAVLELVNSVPELKEKFDRLTSVKGIAVTAGLQLLAELSALPPDMKATQWVAHAGLDPRPYGSEQTAAHHQDRQWLPTRSALHAGPGRVNLGWSYDLATISQCLGLLLPAATEATVRLPLRRALAPPSTLTMSLHHRLPAASSRSGSAHADLRTSESKYLLPIDRTR